MAKPPFLTIELRSVSIELSLTVSKMKIALSIATLIVIIVAGLAIISEKRVSTEILISSSPDKVWSVLMDERSYAQWNPVLIPLHGEIDQGNTITYQWNQANGQSTEADSRVIIKTKNSELHQRGGTPGILTFDHRYKLIPKGRDTLVVQSEVYKGIGVLFWDASQMEGAYEGVNEALKARVENIDE